MKYNRFVLVFMFYLVPFTLSVSTAQQVVVNDEILSQEIVRALSDYYRIQVLEGRYWYDQRSGLWGVEGQPVRGIMLAGLDLGGALKSDASAGTSNVYINGREITRFELLELVKMTGSPIQPGRYWLAANGLAGAEGQPAIVNLYQVAAQYYRRNNNHSGFFRNSYTGVGGGSSGDTFYIIGEDFSYTQ